MAETARPGRTPAYARAPRRAWAYVDLDAVRHNARLLRRVAAPAELCAVVKADAYGHGAVTVARAALEAGARWLAVATVEEGVQLRDAGVAAPVLVLSEPPPDAMDEVLGRSLTPTLYSLTGVEAADHAGARHRSVLDVHVKVDTGMHRVGADPAALGDVVSALAASERLRYAALWTHLAVADGTSDEDEAFTAEQLRRFAHLRREAAAIAGDAPLAHAANSAGAIAWPSARLDLVRCGIALYGSLPAPAVAGALEAALAQSAGAGHAVHETDGLVHRGAAGADAGERADRDVTDRDVTDRAPRAGGEWLRPVLTLRSEVCCTRRLEAGERVSYGRRRPLPVRSVVATVPIGYGDGVPRRYFDEGGTVLIGGHRRPLAGTVTMDQIIVDCGPDAEVSVGDEVVLIGEQGAEHITAWDWAETLGTISYEVLTRIGPRVTRVTVDGDRAPGEPDEGREAVST